MPQIRLEYACPTCIQQAGKHSQMLASDRQLVCSVNPAHVWSDIQTFMSLKAPMVFTVPKAAPPPQFHQQEVKVLIPPRVKDALEAKWGDRYLPTVAAILEIVSEGEVLTLSQTELAKLAMKEFLGSKPGSGAELCGQVYALRQEVQEQKDSADNARKDVAAYENYSPGRVVIDASAFLTAAQEKARDENVPLKIYLERILKNGFDNNWF